MEWPKGTLRLFQMASCGQDIQTNLHIQSKYVIVYKGRKKLTDWHTSNDGIVSASDIRPMDL